MAFLCLFEGMSSDVLNILSVDDEKSVSTSIRLALKSLDCKVDVLHSGKEALAKINESPDHYRILIVDHLTPGVTGLDLLKQLKPTPFKGKIIVLSAHLTEGLEAEYRAIGADKIMRKPFDVDELRKAVEELRP